MDQGNSRIGWPTLVGLGVVVVAFMALSLAVTATGTSRFAVAMGYDAKIGYAIGAIFDVAKAVLLLAVPFFWRRGSFAFAAMFSFAWICLVTFSWLATHSTITASISSIARTGTWKMEVRSNAKAELASVEQQLAALSRPTPPRPAKTVHEALTATNVPPAIWKDSNECGTIQDRAYFAKACSHVVQLRRELAAAEDYEQLSSRAGQLRKDLAAAPIVATSDPLPAAFNATLGRVLPIGGTEGVALLLTMVVEIMSCIGLAGLDELRRWPSGEAAMGSLARPSPVSLDDEGGSRSGPRQTLPQAVMPTLPKPSPNVAALGKSTRVERISREACSPPSNVLPLRARPSPPQPKGGTDRGLAFASHVAAFIHERLQQAKGSSLGATHLRAAYEAWCAAHGHIPLSMVKLAAGLTRLGGLCRGHLRAAHIGITRARPCHQHHRRECHHRHPGDARRACGVRGRQR
jgi:hypothetical protein